MHLTTTTTETRAPGATTTTRRERGTKTPTRATTPAAPGSVVTRRVQPDIDRWARHARSANGFGDASVETSPRPPGPAPARRPGDGASCDQGGGEPTGPRRIRELAERNAEMLALKPNRGHLTGVTKATIDTGLRCVVEEGPWRFAADMPAKAGGGETAPTPGMLGRGALASCLAVGISMWAARLEIPVTDLEVEVQADFDARGELGVDENVPPGYQEVRYLVSIESPASDEDLARLLETAERHSPYLDVFARAQSMKGSVRVNGREV